MSVSVKKSKTGRIFCANCIHCKVVPSSSGNGKQYTLRVKCSAGLWKKKLGEEKIHKYFTVARRSLASCPEYEGMGDEQEFIKELKKTLPINDEVYSNK
jgi:ribosomal protein L28